MPEIVRPTLSVGKVTAIAVSLGKLFTPPSRKEVKIRHWLSVSNCDVEFYPKKVRTKVDFAGIKPFFGKPD